MASNNSLIKCSRCKSTMLPEYFSKNKKGDYFKCCDNCKHNKKDKQITFTDEEYINRARAEWILTTIIDSGETLIYLGQMDPNNVNFPDSKFPKIRGDENTIEYHAFGNMDTKETLIFRWRVKLVPDLQGSIIITTNAAE